MNTFYLWREVDNGGVSGVGKVAEGVEFSNGKCALGWLTGPKYAGRSVCVYDSIADLKAIHGHGGHTKLIVEECVETEQ